MRACSILLVFVLCSGGFSSLKAQKNSVSPDTDRIASGYLDAVADKSASISGQIDRQSRAYLSRLERREERIYKQLSKKDSTAAARALDDSRQQYEAIRQKINNNSQKAATTGRHYIPLLDTVATSLKFFRQYGAVFKQGLAVSEQLNNSIARFNTLENKLQSADDIQSFINSRQQQLSQQLQQVNMGNAILPFSKDAYYYSAQVKEYRDALNDPDKAEQKVLVLLNKLPAFRQFMQQNSQIAALFGSPGGNSASAATALQGLQTRSGVQQMIQNQLGAAGPGAQAMVEQNIQEAQTQLNTLKDKLSKLGGSGNSTMDIPDFKPNSQKTKTFLQRLEFGANIQTQKSGNFFPTTTAFAFSAGYKLNDKSTIGIGAGYMLGWGTDLQHIAFSNQGIGFRSYVDLKLKQSYWISGGAELNYKSAFRDFKVLDDFSPWQKSALLGLTKKYSIGKKLKGNVQLLYDFLWKQQIPVAQPVVFRTGYTF